MKDPYGAVRSAPTNHCRKDPMEIGTIVIRQRAKNGRRHLARYVKVLDTGPPSRRWMLFSRWWWENNRGPIQAGHIVIHKDGDELNDKPGNLILATPGMKLKLAHVRDPAMSAVNREMASAATAEYNRVAGKLHRLRVMLKGYWYPVLDSNGVVFNVPFRRRKTLLAWFGADMSLYPANGQASRAVKKAVLDTGVRPVRGADLESAYYATYSRLDPEWKIGSGRSGKSSKDEERVNLLMGTDLWKRAEEASKLDLRHRK